jgi:hypothetical protein
VALEATRDPALGLHTESGAELTSLDVLAYLAASSPTPRQAFVHMARYVRLMHDAVGISLEVEGDRAIISHRVGGGLRFSRSAREDVISAMVVRPQDSDGATSHGSGSPTAPEYAAGRAASTSPFTGLMRWSSGGDPDTRSPLTPPLPCWIATPAGRGAVPTPFPVRRCASRIAAELPAGNPPRK